jgi:hypothetical protein
MSLGWNKYLSKGLHETMDMLASNIRGDASQARGIQQSSVPPTSVNQGLSCEGKKNWSISKPNWSRKKLICHKSGSSQKTQEWCCLAQQKLKP